MDKEPLVQVATAHTNDMDNAEDPLDALQDAQSIRMGHVTVDESLLPPELRAAVREAIKAAAGGAVTRALDDKQHGHRPPLFAALPLTNVTNQPLSDVTERGRLYQRGRNVVADEFDDLSEADGDEADVDEMHDEVTRKQSESDAKTNAALDVIYRELQQISNELKAKSIALREREARIATQELVLREQQAQLTSTISIATLAESDRARLAMRAEFEEVLKQRDEQARLVAKENRRVGESLKELTAGHRAMRERVVGLEVELAEKEKVVEELRGLFKTTKERNERLRALLEEKREPVERVVVKVKKVPVPTPVPRPATKDAWIQVSPVSVDEDPAVKELVAGQVASLTHGLFHLLAYQLRVSGALAEFACACGAFTDTPFALPALRGKTARDVVEVVDILRGEHQRGLLEGISATLPFIIDGKASGLDAATRESFLELVLGFVRHLDHCGAEGLELQHYLARQLFAQFNETALVAREKPTVAAPALPLTLPTPSEIRLRTLLHLTIAHSREPTVVVPAVDHIQQMAHHEQARNVIFAYGGVGTMWRVIAKSGAEEATIMSVLAVLLELTEEKVNITRVAAALSDPSICFATTTHALLTTSDDAELVERMLMLLQRLSTDATFCAHLRKHGERVLAHLRAVRHRGNTETGTETCDTSNMSLLLPADGEITWKMCDEDDGDASDVQHVGDRTRNFALLNVRSTLKNVEEGLNGRGVAATALVDGANTGRAQGGATPAGESVAERGAEIADTVE